MNAQADSVRLIAENRRARHDYFVEETFEAGIVLTGTEVKSLRLGRLNLGDGYASIEHGEVFLRNVHISPYEQGNRFNPDPLRPRKLLLHRREILRLQVRLRERGMTLVPLSFYFRKGRVKVSLALARGKKLYDKRESQAREETARRLRQVLRERERTSPSE